MVDRITGGLSVNSVDSLDLKQLIAVSRVCGLGEQSGLPDQTRHLIHQADQAKRPLHAEELSVICHASGIGIALPLQLQEQADSLVAQARSVLDRQFPDLCQPGGALHPQDRAEACWRDCWNFLRVVVYAVAAGRSQFTDPEGMVALRELYVRMNVPIKAMRTAMQTLQELCIATTPQSSDQALVRACFDHLLDNLNNSAVKS